jgi:hypothetical protein
MGIGYLNHRSERGGRSVIIHPSRDEEVIGYSYNSEYMCFGWVIIIYMKLFPNPNTMQMQTQLLTIQS